MKTLSYLGLFTILFLFSCSGEDDTVYDEQEDGIVAVLSEEDMLSEIKTLETEINASQVPNEDLLKDAITKYQDYANTYPDAPGAADYLLKASDFSLAVKLPEKSVNILNQIIKKYPDYNRMEDVLYVKASHLDLDLRDTTEAKAAYQDFIDAYPDSEMRDDAENRIENISLSIEELAEKFIKELEAQ
jgi:outer membrane protein assembly factor BamD (BamD/ComL family)